MPVNQQSSVALSALPLFRDIKEALILEKQQEGKSARPGHEPRTIGKNGVNDGERRSSRQYIPPLSAYNASEEAPYFPIGVDEKGRRFDELTMRMDLAQKRLKSIRTLGWNTIRPIGVNETMQQLKERLEKEESESKNASVNNQAQPSALQENDDEFMESFHEYDRRVDPLINNANSGAEDANESREEEDNSYDYDAEFARVEEEEEEEEEEYPNGARTLGAAHALANRSTVRDVTIQQFVETSHIERQPYELDDEYENPQLDIEGDQGESGDFTEVPWVEISDTVQSVDSQRISSLNSLIDRVTIPSVRPQGIRRLSDNNSEI